MYVIIICPIGKAYCNVTLNIGQYLSYIMGSEAVTGETRLYNIGKNFADAH